MRLLVLTIILSSMTSCSLFKKNNDEVRQDKVDKYIQSLKDKRTKASKPASQWVEFYMPQIKDSSL